MTKVRATTPRRRDGLRLGVAGDAAALPEASPRPTSNPTAARSSCAGGAAKVQVTGLHAQANTSRVRTYAEEHQGIHPASKNGCAVAVADGVLIVTVMQLTSPASLGLPLRRGPVRFAVGAPDGLSSNSWRFWTHKGHAYLACRDNLQNMKVSLHASGRWRMAFTHQAVQQNPRLVPPCSDRAWEVWNEPPPTLPDTVIAFRLLFFTSELSVRPGQRPTKTWKDTVFIEAAPPDSGLLKVVTFVVTKDDPDLGHDSQASVRLASLPLNDGRRAQLVAHAEPIADHAIAIDRARDAVLAQATAKGVAVPDEGYLYLFGNQPDGTRSIAGVRLSADSPLG